MPAAQRRSPNVEPQEGDAVIEVDSRMIDDPRSERRVKPKKRAATLADLKNKRARTSEAILNMVDEDGDTVELEVKLQAISGKEYDDLVAEFPPTRKQRDRAFASGGTASFDIDGFAPVLISRCATEPKMSVEDASEIWNSENWSGGEAMGLFMECQRICQGGLDIPFNAAG